MTLIAAIVDRDRTVHMIGDRLACNDANDMWTLNYPKIAILTPPHGKDKVLIGACGNIELAVVCTQLFSPPPLPEDESGLAFYRWVLNDMRPKFREEIARQGLFKKDKDGEPELPGRILVAARGQMIVLERKVIPVACQRSHWAIGSGEDYCTGIVHHSLKNATNQPTARQCRDYLLAGMRVSVELRNTIGPPFDYINTKGEQQTFEK